MAARLMPRCELECMDRPMPERLADGGQFTGAAQPAPVVVVGEEDLDRVLLDAGFRCSQATTHMLVASGMRRGPSRPPPCRGWWRWVLQYSRHAVQFPGHVPRSLHRPGRVGVEPQRLSREGLGECPDRGDLLVGREDTALELERAEAVPLLHQPGLLDDPGRVERLAPLVADRRASVERGCSAHL
jgi:hypothetical protein